jgi:hypothetical protein
MEAEESAGSWLKKCAKEQHGCEKGKNEVK